MGNYESTSKKIRTIWQGTAQNINNSNRLKSGLVKIVPLNYIKIINKYSVYVGTINNTDPIIFKVKLTNFPESIFPNLRTILISTSASSEIESYNISNTIYIFYRGIATINVSLNNVNPHDSK